MGDAPAELRTGAAVRLRTHLPDASKRGAGGRWSGGILGRFSQSGARLYNPEHPETTFADVAGIDEVKAELVEIVDFLKKPEKYQRLGGTVPKGVLLIGAPGTGKTLLARAVAGEAGVPFFSISASEFIEAIVGVGAARVRDLFQKARGAAPAIVFIDELDAVGRSRSTGARLGGNEEQEQTLNQILTEMDGFDPHEGVIVLAATNRADVLDVALLRPGRFDRRITVPFPDRRGRLEILRIHTRHIPLGADVDLGIIASLTAGMVGADLRNLANEAALAAARREAQTVMQIDFTDRARKGGAGVRAQAVAERGGPRANRVPRVGSRAPWVAAARCRPGAPRLDHPAWTVPRSDRPESRR